MASTRNTMTSASLPAKKRKASNASTATNSTGQQRNQESTANTSSSVTNSAKAQPQHYQASVAVRDNKRLPSKKRKGSHDSSKTGSIKLPAFSSAKPPPDSSQASSRKLSDTSLKVDELFQSPKSNDRDDILYQNAAHGTTLPEVPEASALDHLDALGPTLVVAANQKKAAATEENALPNNNHPVSSSSSNNNNINNIAAAKRKGSVGDDNSSSATAASSGQRLLLEAIMMASQSDSQANAGDNGGVADGHHQALQQLRPNAFASSRRDRLESWGGMSDISMPHVEVASLSAATLPPPLPGSNQSAAQQQPSQQPHQLDRSFTLNLEDDDPFLKAAIPAKISLHRDRGFSVASLSETSAFNIPIFPDGDVILTGADLQAYVAAAVASVGDQLAELAGAVESAAGPASVNFMSGDAAGQLESETSSVASNLIIGAASDNGRGRGRLRSWSTGSGKISVDMDAIQMAVDAAQAAAAGLNLSTLTGTSQPATASAAEISERRSESRIRNTKRKLPLKRNRTETGSPDSSSTEDMGNLASLSEREIDNIRKRTQANVYAKPPPDMPTQPLKKRIKRKAPTPDVARSTSAGEATPRVSNKMKRLDESVVLPVAVPSSAPAAKPAVVKPSAADQKWDNMFGALLKYVEERRVEETKNMTPEEKAAWTWEGHVPTVFKTKDGKALGRWINNQRSAKGKDQLREDREDRLVAAGLKWSVLTSNAWNEMFEELRIYINEQVAQGKQWNGNVPASYQIKSRNTAQDGEDRNLGRWVK